MEEWKDRTAMLVGHDGIDKINKSNVLVAGLGGVGSFAAEFLCRAGIGKMAIADNDTIQSSNRNRQLHALKSTEGRYKTEVMAERLKDINPKLSLTVYRDYLKDEKIPELLSTKFDYIVDAIDTLSPKFYLIFNAIQENIPVVSSMGSGGRYDPSKIMISDISESYNCRLAYYIRKKLHKHGIIKGIKVVFSSELPDKKTLKIVEETNKKSIAGTISYMPAIFGAYCASTVLRDILFD